MVSFFVGAGVTALAMLIGAALGLIVAEVILATRR